MKILFLLFIHRNPTPFGNKDETLLGVEWKPVNGSSPHDVPYLNIDKGIEMKENPDAQRLEFWDKLYDKYNGNSLSNTV